MGLFGRSKAKKKKETEAEQLPPLDLKPTAFDRTEAQGVLVAARQLPVLRIWDGGRPRRIQIPRAHAWNLWYRIYSNISPRASIFRLLSGGGLY